MEGPYAQQEAKNNLERISWDTASYIWYKGIPGIEEDKQKGIDNLRTFWTKRVGLVPKGMQVDFDNVKYLLSYLCLEICATYHLYYFIDAS
jgi:hypothetical protein